ncbi:MAG TPA: glycoside hydrolase family 11 protein, partial [Clostridia bacterium]
MKQKTMVIFAILMCFTILTTLFTVQAATTITSNQTGTQSGYDYELWKDFGNTSMTLYDGGAFSCQWSDIGNALFRIGKRFNRSQTHQQVGDISVNYSSNFQPSGDSYLAVYGWTVNRLVEYYIVESWGTWKPPGAQSKGTITVDGGTYDIYDATQREKPNMLSENPLYRYFSVRTSKRTSGTVSVSEHFKAWESKGMKMGNLSEVSLLVEGYQSSGKADVDSMSINIVNPVSTPSPSPTPAGITYGDVDGDGKINSTDLSSMKRYVLGMSTLNNTNAGDLNGDGSINSTDVSLLKRYILGIVTSLPINRTQTS